MSVEITVPALGESVTEAEVAKWFKQVGDAVEADEPLVELETDKVTLEVNAPAAGVLAEIVAGEGAEVEVGAVLGRIDETGAAVAVAAATKAPAAAAPEPEPDPEPEPEPEPAPLSPAVRKLVAEHDLDPGEIEGTGKDGRLTKDDVEAWLAARTAAVEEAAAPEPEPAPPKPAPAKPAAAKPAPVPLAAPRRAEDEREHRVRMSRLRRRIAERLKEAQNSAAMLTTFNDVDMTAILDLRKRYRDSFEKRHGVRLGFMSFFVKACIEALKEIPAVNAEIDGDDIVYKELLRHRRRRRHGTGARRPDPARRRRPVFRGDRADDRRTGRQGARRRPLNGRAHRRHLHHLERRGLRLHAVDADPEPAAIRHPRYAPDRAAPGSPGRARSSSAR